MSLSQLRDSFLALFVIAIGSSGCVEQQCGKPIVTYEQVCDSCSFSANELPLIEAFPSDSFVFRKPVAIQYFNLATHPRWFDTVRDRQPYYNIMDQYGYYGASLRGYIRGMNVEVIDSLPGRNVLFFEDDKNEYVIDAARFMAEDGVLLWTPGKRPVLWNDDVATHHCSDSTFLHCYFRNH